MTKKDEAQAEGQVVEAVGTATASDRMGGGYTSHSIQEVMSAAALKANAEGISDPDIIRERALEARLEFKRQAREEAEARRQVAEAAARKADEAANEAARRAQEAAEAEARKAKK